MIENVLASALLLALAGVIWFEHRGRRRQVDGLVRLIRTRRQPHGTRLPMTPELDAQFSDAIRKPD